MARPKKMSSMKGSQKNRMASASRLSVKPDQKTSKVSGTKMRRNIGHGQSQKGGKH